MLKLEGGGRYKLGPSSYFSAWNARLSPLSPGHSVASFVVKRPISSEKGTVRIWTDNCFKLRYADRSVGLGGVEGESGTAWVEEFVACGTYAYGFDVSDLGLQRVLRALH